ncbi:MAG: DNA-3-methyladenine glycosylase [Patescibacteria group bacterium]
MITSRQTPTVRQARAMLGTFLVRRWHNREIASMITEVEAYDGPHDKASHASRGMTSRNAVMFGKEGVWYVYLCYGIHWMLNYVVGDTGYPAAILIRGVEDAIGPGNVTKFFHVTGAQNGKAVGHLSGLWIEDRGVRVPKTHIVAVPRVGIPHAQDWKDKPLRFLMRK